MLILAKNRINPAEGALALMSCHAVWVQVAQINETISTCRFAQRMMRVSVDARRKVEGLSSVHGNLMRLDPMMQQYLTVSVYLNLMLLACICTCHTADCVCLE